MQLFRQYQSLLGELSMDIDEYIVAVRAADSMAKAWRSDVAILSNLQVVKLNEAQGTILEIVRWDL